MKADGAPSGAAARQPRVSAIDVWLTFVDEIIDEPLLMRYAALLDHEERQKQARFQLDLDRKRYLVTRAMVRSLLSTYADIAPAAWRFIKNSYGRPQIANEHAETLGLRFNVSHTRGLIAVAVAHGREVGVDVENVLARRASEGIANRFFAPCEAAELALTACELRQGRFFEYWTFKEAYIKARGVGMSIALDRFHFTYPDDTAVRLSVAAGLGDDPQRWSFWQYRPAPPYLLALCAERLRDDPVHVSVRRFVPEFEPQLLELPVLRTSRPSSSCGLPLTHG